MTFEPGILVGFEVAANAFNLVSILLAGRNRVETWWTGIVGCSLFGVLFLGTQLYADATLQVFFIVTSAIGWWRWRTGGGQGRSEAGDLPIRRTPSRVIVAAFAAAVGVTLGYGTLLHVLTDAYAPYVDSVVLAFSVVAQVLLMGRRLETWAFWMVVNTVAVPLYLSRGLWPTALLYVGFWINACVSWRHWLRLWRTTQSGVASGSTMLEAVE
ncbi:MAG: nicotinamide riboside transporter PnuC [Opitutaceae bacterium]